jgi:hypothetical protein
MQRPFIRRQIFENIVVMVFLDDLARYFVHMFHEVTQCIYKINSFSKNRGTAGQNGRKC